MKEISPIFNQIIPRTFKEKCLNQKAKVIWFTGLSASGKTTLASKLEKYFFEKGYFAKLLDGDNVRTGLNSNLGFSQADRLENIRRISEVSKLFLECGVILICSFVSPTRKIRQVARDIIGEQDFLEIFVNTPLEVCEKRDYKGLYKKAREGKIKEFTGISSPFENPENPFLEIINSSCINESFELLIQKILPEIKL